MKIWAASIIPLLLFSSWSLANLQNKEIQNKLLHLSTSKEWLRLGHYKKTLLGGYQSYADGTGLFISSEGKTNPFAELTATWQAFLEKKENVGPHKLPIHCAFPARARFLANHHIPLPTPQNDCPQLAAFRKELRPQSVTLIFASNYPSNPASFFGHTFLKFNKEKPKWGGSPLLDQAIGFYAGVHPEDGQVKMSILGLLGGYTGRFLIGPYDIKIREYNHMEGRDLWEYDLNLTPPQIEQMVDHIWEMEVNGEFDYYFLDENCSFQLLTVLEVANPHWDLVPHRALYVLPGETIKPLKEMGAILGWRYRPSLRTLFLERYADLTSEEKKLYQKVVENKIRPHKNQGAKILDTVLAFYAYKKFKNDHILGPHQSSIYLNVLAQRSQIPSPPSSPPPQLRRSPPDLSHDTYGIGLSLGLTQGQLFQEFVIKPSLHDLLNQDNGHNPNSEINYLKAYFRHQKQRISLERFDIFSMTSLPPISPVDFPLSWSADIRFHRPRDQKDDGQKYFLLSGGMGASFGPLSSTYLVYGLAKMNVEYGWTEVSPWRGGPGLRLGAILRPYERTKIQLQSEVLTDFWQSRRQKYFTKHEFNLSHSLSRNMDLRAALYWIAPGKKPGGRSFHEQRLELHYFF